MQINVESARMRQLENRLVAELNLSKKLAARIAFKFKSTLVSEGAKGVASAFYFIAAMGAKQPPSDTAVNQPSAPSVPAANTSETIGAAKPWREIMAAIAAEGKPGLTAAKPAEGGTARPWKEVIGRIEGKR